MIALIFTVCTMAGECVEAQLDTFDTLERCEAVIPAASAFIMQQLSIYRPEGVFLAGLPECRQSGGPV